MKKICCLFLFLLLFLFACVREDDVPGANPDTGSNRVSHIVPIEDALSGLREILAPLQKDTRAGRSYAVKGVDVVATGGATRAAGASEGTDTLLYIVNFEDDGYALLAADDRLEGVIALVDEGNISAEEFVASAAATTPVPEMGGLPDFSIPLRMLIMRYVENIEDEKEVGTPVFYTPWYPEVLCQPLMKTKWNQVWPFNIYCPVVNGQNCVAGCVAIALAQIAAYNQSVHNVGPDVLHEIALDWNGIRAYLSDPDHTDPSPAALLVYAMGREVDMDYGLEKSSAEIKKAARALSWLGYRMVFNHRYNVALVEEMVLERRLPVYIRGTAEHTNGKTGGHAWVIDGYYRYRRDKTSDDPSKCVSYTVFDTYYTELVHCNFGWGGSCNGYYIADIFDLTQGATIPDPDSSYWDIENFVDKRILMYEL